MAVFENAIARNTKCFNYDKFWSHRRMGPKCLRAGYFLPKKSALAKDFFLKNNFCHEFKNVRYLLSIFILIKLKP